MQLVLQVLNMADTLFEEVNPFGNIQAVVETDGEVCYFYLFSAPETNLGMKSVWVCNHGAAPDAFDVERMRAGSPPRNVKAHCRHPRGLPTPNPDNLRVVWLPEGNGAALYENDQIIAIIPPWSGSEGFHGYSRDNIGEGPVAWELSPDNVLIQRFADAEAAWARWDADDFWQSIQTSLISLIEKVLGKHSNYYAIDGGEWPPKAMVRFLWNKCTVLITIGLSLHPQPNIELATENPELLRRIELGVVLPGSWPEKAIKAFGGYLSGQANLPWKQYTWLGPGHTLPCDVWQNPAYEYALLTHSHAGAPRLALGKLFDDPVNVLWLVPISDAERQLAMDEGSDRLVKGLAADRWMDA